MGTAGVDRHVVLRYTDEDNYYWVVFRSGRYQDIGLVKVENGSVEHLKWVSFANQPNRWYRLKIVAQGDSIQIYANDQLYINYTDPGTTLTSGRIGVSGWTGVTCVVGVHFDNVVVKSLPAPTAAPTPPSPPLTPTPDATVGITGNICVEGICLEVKAWNWFVELVVGQGPGPPGIDTCQPRENFTADFAVEIVARNNSGQNVLLQYSDYDFRVEDNTGRQFELFDFSCTPALTVQIDYHPSSYEMMFKAGQEMELGPTYALQKGPVGAWGASRETDRFFVYKGGIRPDTEYLILHVENFSRIPYASWKFEVPR